MITLTDGSLDCLPYVKVEIEPGRWPFQWGYEVHYWDADNKLEDGTPLPCWVHDWQKDSGGFGLWFVWRKAQEAMFECYSEQI